MQTTANPHFIAGKWQPGQGEPFQSFNPSTGQPMWEARAAALPEIEEATRAALQAQPAWAALPLEDRAAALLRFARLVEKNPAPLAEAISAEVGKPAWEARGEVAAVIGKAALSIEAFQQRCSPIEKNGATTRFLPHGIVAVLGPFNFPAHLPNGHIMPALLAGNAVIFKPSDLSPLVAEVMLRYWSEAGLPPGILQLLQGGASTALLLLDDPSIRGIFFTGSSRVGLQLNEKFSHHPDTLLALEMGGNNPLILHRSIPTETAVPLVLQSAFSSSGQRCNCTRRLILTPDAPAGFLPVLLQAARQLRIDPPEAEPPPFYGPLISQTAVHAFHQTQDDLALRHAICHLRGQSLPGPGHFVSPAIWEITDPASEPDTELFAPLLKIYHTPDFSSALALANQTRFGLAAALLSSSPSDWETARRTLHVGVLNWNQPTTAASSAASFGGLGQSGNHRPSAFLAADYCVRPQASMGSSDLPPGPWPPGLLPQSD